MKSNEIKFLLILVIIVITSALITYIMSSDSNHFDDINAGDTTEHVRDLMGNPDSFFRSEDGTQVIWDYDDEGEVRFFLGRVDKKTSNQYYGEMISE